MVGNPPVLFSNVTNVWQPNPEYHIEKTNSRNQLVEPTRINLSKEVPLHLFVAESQSENDLDYKLLKRIQALDQLPIDIDKIQQSNKEISEDKDFALIDKQDNAWSMSVSDIPTAGNARKVCMQTITESVILGTSKNNTCLPIFIRELGYSPEYSYITVGVHFFMKFEIIIDVQKIWKLDNSSNNTSQLTKKYYLIKAYANVASSTDIERINHTEKALLALQRELHGYLELKVPDRKVMDSRVKEPINSDPIVLSP